MPTSIGEILCVALEADVIAEREREFFLEYQPAGVTLFARNIAKPTQELKKLNQSIQDLNQNDLPLIIAIDQEGGRVDRFKREDFPNLGPALKLQNGNIERQDLAEIHDYGKLVGLKLKSLGVNVNFAPVCDLDTEPTNTAIGDRCFGKTVEQAVPRAKAFMKGLQSSGVLGCLKHFPGQGNAKADTHFHAAKIPLSLDELRQREFVPFIDLLPLTQMVMVSHCVYPALDDVEASLSKVIMHDLLRNKMGFKGVIVSDDMNMEALNQKEGDWEKALINCVLAGGDLILVCRDIEKCFRAADIFERECESSAAFRVRVEESARRVRKLRDQLI